MKKNNLTRRMNNKETTFLNHSNDTIFFWNFFSQKNSILVFKKKIENLCSFKKNES